MAFRAYRSFRLALFNGSKYTWAGTDYSNMMLSDDIVLPDTIAANTSMSYNVPMNSSTYTGNHTFSVIIPEVFDLVNVIDGTIRGITKVAAVLNDGHTHDYVRINSCSLGLVAVDNVGNERTILAPTVIDSTAVQSPQYGGTTSRIFMWWLDVGHAEIRSNERLRIDYIINYTTYDYLNDDSGSIRILNAANGDENIIVLPFVVS